MRTPRAHREFLSALRTLRKAHPDVILDVREVRLPAAPAIRVRLNTSSIPHEAGGLELDEHEDFVFYVPPDFPIRPPTVLVEHDRFLGFTHVLIGRIICIYLDPAREWHPGFTVAHVVDRVLTWLNEAASAQFDSASALFHAIGGLPPEPRANKIAVIRIDEPQEFKALSLGAVALRTDRRLDLVSWRSSQRPSAPLKGLLLVRTQRALPRGLGGTLAELVGRVAAANGPDPTILLEATTRLIAGTDTDDSSYIGVVVPHPDVRKLSHVSIAEIPADFVARMRSTPTDQWPLSNIPMRWLAMSDERPGATVRRDASRPTAAVTGKRIEIWGCGGLGSWIAEFIVRAGPASVVVRDSGGVGGGLLVRQDYVELDVGRAKAEALAERLNAISDGVDVRADVCDVATALDSGIPECDLVIDATVNVSVAARLDAAARAVGEHPLLAQVVTDARTATLGLVLVVGSGTGVGPATVDDEASKKILSDGALERFHGFWTPSDKRDQLVPAPGCSVPTFHGSAADLACLAGSMVTLIASHFGSPFAGAHLLAVAHAGGLGPSHLFVPR